MGKVGVDRDGREALAQKNHAWINPSLTPTKTLTLLPTTGPGLVLAKAVQDCAQGGMVLLSEDTFSQLRVEELKAQLLVCARMGVSTYSKLTLQGMSQFQPTEGTLEGAVESMRAHF